MRVGLCVSYEGGRATMSPTNLPPEPPDLQKDYVEIFRKKTFGECKRQIFVIGDKNTVRENCIAEARRRSVSHENDFD